MSGWGATWTTDGIPLPLQVLPKTRVLLPTNRTPVRLSDAAEGATEGNLELSEQQRIEFGILQGALKLEKVRPYQGKRWVR